VDGTGIPIAGITTDIDGNVRDGLASDMGCDEFSVIPPVPMAGLYDIGGGDYDFYTIIGAIDTLRMRGMGGPVTFEAYTGTYAATVTIDKWIPGLGAANPLVVQNAPGESPFINWWEWGNIQAFDIYCADYVTIRGIAVDVLGSNIIVHGNPNDYCEQIVIDKCIIPGNALPFVQNGIIINYTQGCQITRNIINNVPRGLTIAYADDGLVANNMFYSANYYTLYGLNASYVTNTEFVYNSFSINGSYCSAIQADDSTITFKNNILKQDYLDGYCMHLYGPVISDYNCYYNYYNHIVYNGNYYNLPDWQTASGQDMHSLTGNPQFISVADLHIDPYVISPVSDAGIPVASVSVDFDGEPRSLTSPDIGADEYFFIGQYGVLLTPEDTTGIDTTGNTIYYPFNVINTGTMIDSYNLTIEDTTWPAAIFDMPGGSQISAVFNLDPDDTVCVYVSHSVPEGVPEQFVDSGLLIATSVSSAAAADTSTFTTNAIIWPPVKGYLYPDLPSIVIPAGGGIFTYDYKVINYDLNNPYLIRIWKSVDMPNGQNINLFAITFTIAAGDTIERHITQIVPANALPGVYSYHLKIMHQPDWEVWDDDMLTFTKEAGDGSGSPYQEWQTLGWEDEPLAPIIPTKYYFAAPSPNPFNPKTMLSFDLPQAGKVELVIYNISGRMVGKVVDGFYNAGSYKFAFDASNLPSGIYFARLQAGDYSKTQKLALVK